MPDSEQPTNGDNIQGQGIMGSVTMSFNMGVSHSQKDGTKSVVDVAAELRDEIYTQIKAAYGEHLEDSFIQANVEYFVQIALMGYIIPSICVFDPEFKDHLFRLIEAKLAKKEEQPKETSRIITT